MLALAGVALVHKRASLEPQPKLQAAVCQSSLAQPCDAQDCCACLSKRTEFSTTIAALMEPSTTLHPVALHPAAVVLTPSPSAPAPALSLIHI